MKTDVVQKALVITSEGKILILRRSKTDVRRPLQWDLPGGLLEPNEELIVGIEREIFEETGLTATDITPVYASTQYQTWEAGQANVVRIYYVAHVASIEVKLSFEHDEYKWLTVAEAKEEISYPFQKDTLGYLLENKLVL